MFHEVVTSDQVEIIDISLKKDHWGIPVGFVKKKTTNLCRSRVLPTNTQRLNTILKSQ